MAAALEDFADDEMLKIRSARYAGLGHPLHLGTGEGQAGSDLVDLHLYGHELFEP